MRIRIEDVKNDIFTAVQDVFIFGKAFTPCSAAFLSCYSIGEHKRIVPCKKIV
jgi:hypothetical protein